MDRLITRKTKHNAGDSKLKYTMTEKTLRIAEAMQYAQDHGRKITKIELAGAIWPSRSSNSNYESLDRLISGKAVFVPISAISEICRITGVDANFLFGIDLSLPSEP